MKTKEEIKKWILENCVYYNGTIDLSGLDFSNFDGNVDISGMKVKNNLYQEKQEVKGHLWQMHQKVDGNLYQEGQIVKGNLWQVYQRVDGNLLQAKQFVKGDLSQHDQKVEGKLLQDCNCNHKLENDKLKKELKMYKKHSLYEY